MTEAGENFLQRNGFERPEVGKCERAIRAFCDEVERRRWKKDFYVDSYDVFLQLKRELLGD